MATATLMLLQQKLHLSIMKKALLALGTILSLATVSTAQSKLYIQPSVNFGVGSSQTSSNTNAVKPEIKSTLTYGAGLGIGYRLGDLRLETGLRYDISGFRHNLIYSNISGPFEGEVTYKYHHISVPLSVGYEIKIGKRFSITPLVGVMASYNAGGSNKVSGVPFEAGGKMDSKFFGDMYNRLSIWGTGSIRFNYQLSNKVSIFIAPTAQYMISNFQNTSSNSLFKSSLRNYNIGCAIGVSINL